MQELLISFYFTRNQIVVNVFFIIIISYSHIYLYVSGVYVCMCVCESLKWIDIMFLVCVCVCVCVFSPHFGGIMNFKKMFKKSAIIGIL